jgi:hypothetical protein
MAEPTICIARNAKPELSRLRLNEPAPDYIVGS